MPFPRGELYMKFVSKLALAAALTLGASAVGSAPALAQKADKAAEPQLKVSDAFRKAAVAAETALKAKDLATADTQLSCRRNRRRERRREILCGLPAPPARAREEERSGPGEGAGRPRQQSQDAGRPGQGLWCGLQLHGRFAISRPEEAGGGDRTAVPQGARARQLRRRISRCCSPTPMPPPASRTSRSPK
jgi:hypothetical protein